MDAPLVALPQFVQATRDAGYRGVAQAIAELIDNAIQAGARTVDISVARGDGARPEIQVVDDGAGMDTRALAACLSFGGSSRFDDRSGLGRFGMGLPNGSLSQARRVEVYSWQESREPLFTYIDADEVAEGRQTGVPAPVGASLPAGARVAGPCGTMVRWMRCDRLADRRLGAVATELRQALGGIFRYFLWRGLALRVDGVPCVPLDPLLVRVDAGRSATVFGEPLTYKVASPQEDVSGTVSITFSELPVHAWHGLSSAEKRRLGVIKGAGVSIVRADREIDRGWFFMGEKRRENYDDWWRCEIRFDPDLDEGFGLTHTKQQIRPSRWLSDALTPDVEAVGRALNARVRRSHATLKARERYSGTEARANALEQRLPPLPAPDQPEASDLLARLTSLYPGIDVAPTTPDVRLVEDDLGLAGLFDTVLADRRLIVVLNTAHPFYKRAYEPLADSDEPGAAERRSVIETLVVALARAEVACGGAPLAKYRRAWGDALAELSKS
jgi:hypothetical protein